MVPYDFPRERPRRLSPTERVFLDAYLGPDVVVDQPVGARA